MYSKARLLMQSATAVVATVLFCTACGQSPTGSSATPQATAGGLAIAFKALAQPAKGDNKVEAVVTQDGQPVTDATVAATFRMPAMPSMNMPEMHTTSTLEHQGGGRYVGNGQLSMAGTWNVTVTVSRGGTQLGSARFTLQAK
jgi:hypothetical protein